MWHASASYHPPRLLDAGELGSLRSVPRAELGSVSHDVDRLLDRALAVLDGVGRVGEPCLLEISRTAVHLRLRLSPTEESVTGPAVDVRGDPVEVTRRLAATRHLLPLGWNE